MFGTKSTRVDVRILVRAEADRASGQRLGLNFIYNVSLQEGPLLIPMKVRSRKWAKRLIFGHVLSAAPIPNPAILGHLP